MKRLIPIAAGVLDSNRDKNINLEWVVENDPTEPFDLIFCLVQIDREIIPGSSVVLDEKTIYISMPELRRLCLQGLRIYKDMKQMIEIRQMEQYSELDDLLMAMDDSVYE